MYRFKIPKIHVNKWKQEAAKAREAELRREQEAAIARIQAEAEAKARAEMRERARVAEETRLREEHEARIKAQVRRARVNGKNEKRMPRHGIETQPTRSYNKGVHVLL